MTYLYHTCPSHPQFYTTQEWPPRAVTPGMVYIPISIPLAYGDPGGIFPTYVDLMVEDINYMRPKERRSGEERRGERRSCERRTSEHRDRVDEPTSAKNLAKSKRREQEKKKHRSGDFEKNEGESGDAGSFTSHTSHRSHYRPHRTATDSVAAEHQADRDQDKEMRNRARLTLCWVRALVPGIPPPSHASPPVSPEVRLSTASGYFYPQPASSRSRSPVPDRLSHPLPTQEVQRPTTRPPYRRQSSIERYVRKLTPVGSRRPPPPAYESVPPYQPQRAPLQPLPSRTERVCEPGEGGKILESVAWAWAWTEGVRLATRPRKVRFADGGVPGSSRVE